MSKNGQNEGATPRGTEGAKRHVEGKKHPDEASMTLPEKERKLPTPGTRVLKKCLNERKEGHWLDGTKNRGAARSSKKEDPRVRLAGVLEASAMKKSPVY